MYDVSIERQSILVDCLFHLGMSSDKFVFFWG